MRSDLTPVDAVDLATSIAWITERDSDDERRNRLLHIALDGLLAADSTRPIGSPISRRRGLSRSVEGAERGHEVVRAGLGRRESGQLVARTVEADHLFEHRASGRCSAAKPTNIVPWAVTVP